jgi:hypothetical protein
MKILFNIIQWFLILVPPVGAVLQWTGHRTAVWVLLIVATPFWAWWCFCFITGKLKGQNK